MNLATAARRLPIALAIGAASLGCIETGLTTDPITSVAVTAGDFDDVSQPLERMVVAHDLYDGIISTATWDEDFNHEAIALKVEDLLGNGGEIGAHSAVFLASGTRGLGGRQYNALEPDDHLVTDPVVIENVQLFVDNGGRLVVTDWAYDLIEAAWPDAVRWLNDDSVLDAAQRGEIGRVTADVVHGELADRLGIEQAAIDFNYSNWAVIAEVDRSVDVYLTADISYRPDSQSEIEDATGVPIMFGYQPRGARGRVIFMSFHIDAQTPALIDQLILETVGTFQAPAPETFDGG